MNVLSLVCYFLVGICGVSVQCKVHAQDDIKKMANRAQNNKNEQKK